MKLDNDLISDSLVQNVFAVHRFAQGGRRLAVRTAMECHFDALPCTPFCLFEAFPLKGKRGIWRGKTESHIFHVPFRRFPPLVAGATTFPPLAEKVRRSRIRGSRVAANHQNGYFAI